MSIGSTQWEAPPQLGQLKLWFGPHRDVRAAPKLELPKLRGGLTVLPTAIRIAKVRFRPEPGSRRFFGLRAELGSAPVSFTWQIPSHKGT